MVLIWPLRMHHTQQSANNDKIAMLRMTQPSKRPREQIFIPRQHSLRGQLLLWKAIEEFCPVRSPAMILRHRALLDCIAIYSTNITLILCLFTRKMILEMNEATFSTELPPVSQKKETSQLEKYV